MKAVKLSHKLLGFLPKPSIDIGSQENDDVHSTKTTTTGQLPQQQLLYHHMYLETFLEKLTHASDTDGQIVMDTTTKGKETLEFCVLNPAVQADDDLWTVPRAIGLVGGTLQPLGVMMQQLFPLG
jgi:hypothetical protein